MPGVDQEKLAKQIFDNMTMEHRTALILHYGSYEKWKEANKTGLAYAALFELLDTNPGSKESLMKALKEAFVASEGTDSDK